MQTRILLAPDSTAGAAAVAPKAPAAAPAPAAATTPAPAPKSAPEASGGEPDAFSDLDTKATAPKVKKPDAAPPKEGEAKPDPKSTPAPEDKDAKTFQSPKALREAHERSKTELATVKATLAEKERILAEREKNGGDTTKLSEAIAAKEKRISELEGEIRNVKFEVSPEFKAKYEQPFNDAAEYGAEQINQMEVTDPETGTVRPASWDKDFAAIYQLPVGKALTVAKELFGDGAPIVMQHYHELHRKDRERSKAMEGEKANAKTREAEAIQNRTRNQEAAKVAWEKVNKDIVERNPDKFGDDPADAEGNELLKSGYALVDKAFDQGERGKMTMQQRITLDANIRHRAAGFSRQLHRANLLKQEVADLKAEIEKYRGGGPGPTARTAGGGGGGGEKEVSMKDDKIWGELKEAPAD